MNRRDTIYSFVVWAVIALGTIAWGAILGVAMWLAFSSLAHSHEWYDSACCNEEDCRPVEASSITYDATKGIYFWKSDRSGKLYAFHKDNISTVDKLPKVRVSKDGRYHGCEANTADKPGQPANWIGYCLYLPPLM